MTLTFLTPVGVLLALAFIVPLTALLLVRRRARRVRGALGVSEPSRRGLAVWLLSLLVASALIGLAAAQPVLAQTKTLRVRTDAEVWFVLDVSRSMLAQADPGSPTRFARATNAAERFRASLAGTPVGIASMTTRVLPHLFPGANEDVFQTTLDRSLGIERPPPPTGLATVATDLSSLGMIRGLRYFSPSKKKRLVVVFTDGESTAVSNARVGTIFRQSPAIGLVFVHVWNGDERVFTRNTPEAAYLPDPAARSTLDRLAESTRGSVYSEGDLDAAVQAGRELLGDGPTAVQGESGRRHALAPYLALVAFLPLTLLLARPDV